MGSQTPLFTVRIADNNYVLNYTGDQIADAIRRMLEFDPTTIGNIRIESTTEVPCDLDLLRAFGDYFVEVFKHGPADVQDVVGAHVRVCEINEVTHQIMYVSDDIYVRKFDEDTNTWSEWDAFGFGTTIFDGNVPPIEKEDGTLWVDTSGTRPQLKRFNGVEWVQFSPVGPGEMSEFIHNTVLLTSNLSIVPTGIKEYNKSKGHMMMAFINSTLLVESTDYEILEDGIHIRKINGSWAGSPANPITFDFYLFIPGIAAEGEGSGTSAETEAEIAELRKRLELLQLYLGELEDRLAEATGATGTSIKELEERIAAINEAIDTINRTIADLTQSVHTNRTDIDTLMANMQVMQNQIDELKRIIDEGGIIGELPANLVYHEVKTPSEPTPATRSVSKATTKAVNNRLPENLVYYKTPSGETKPL